MENCEICDQKFWSVMKLKIHIAIEHLNQEGTLPSEFNDAKKYNLESKNHFEIFKCQFEGCDKTYETQHKRNKHYKELHLKIEQNECINEVKESKLRYACDLCGHQIKNNKFYLLCHMNSNHLKIKPFECKMCDFKTSRSDSLKRHILSIHLKFVNKRK